MVRLSPNLLLVLAVLLQTRSVSNAALKLGMSQPSVSRALAKLRDALNDPLLVRSGVGMARTRRGDELVERLADWMANTSTLLASPSFDPHSERRQFRVASTDFGVMAVILPAIERLRVAAPLMRIDVVPLSHATHRALAQGEIDLAISGLDHDPSLLHRSLLFRDRFVCVTRKGHPLTAGSTSPVPLDEFIAWPHLGLTVSEAELDRVLLSLGDAVKDREVAASLPYFGMAADMLVAGDLVSVLPSRTLDVPYRRAACGHVLAVRPAPEGLGELEYWLLWHERSRRDPASIWLRDELARACNPDGEATAETCRSSRRGIIDIRS